MSVPVERILYGDRTIRSRQDEATGEEIAGWPNVAYEAIRAQNHITLGRMVPAPVAYSVLGNLAGAASMLPQLCNQLANGLKASLNELDVYDTKHEPSLSVQEAGELLSTAATHAERLADALSAAQVAIRDQGYNQ